MKRSQRLCLCCKNSAFSQETTIDGDSIRVCMRLLPRKTEHLVLLGPFGWQVGEASNAHAMGKPAIDGRFDQIGGKESQRDCHVDLSHAALFPPGNAVGTCCWISDEFVKPTTATGNCCHQPCARLRTYRTR